MDSKYWLKALLFSAFVLVLIFVHGSVEWRRLARYTHRNPASGTAKSLLLNNKGQNQSLSTDPASSTSTSLLLNCAGHIQSLSTDPTSTTPKPLLFDSKWYNESLFREMKTSTDMWFLETSNRRNLTGRAACAIESACRYHPDYTVHLLTTENITETDCPYYRALSKYKNFRFELLDVNFETRGSPLAEVIKRKDFQNGLYATEHLSDILRLIVMWKRGGIYVDTDMIIMKSLKGIRNAVVYEFDGTLVSNSFLFFDATHPAIGALIDKCALVYSPNLWLCCGPHLFNELAKDCVFSRLVRFLSMSEFLNPSYPKWRTLFNSTETATVFKTIERSYSVHLWNSLSRHTLIVPKSGSAVDILSRMYCPEVYKLASVKAFF